MAKNRESSGNSVAMAATSGQMTFGPFRFVPLTGELWRGDQEIKLTPRAAAVLAVLVRRPQTVVTKQELVDLVWKVKAVGDEALSSSIQELRRALGDDARRPRYLQTRHRRGYRLIVPVTGDAVPIPDAAGELPSGKPSLAVLPFDNLSPDPDQDYFADGVVEDMTTALSRISSIFVMSRNSSFTLKGRKVLASEIGRLLGVRYIVEGTVRRVGQKLRLTAHLTEAETGRQLWAERYDGGLADVFDLQDRIVASIVGAISPTVRAAEIERARLKRPDSLQAYDYLLRAYPGYWSYVDPGHKDALELLHKALELAPNYAFAMALAAHGHAERFSRVVTAEFESEGRQAIKLATAALEAAPDDPDVLIAAGMALLLARPHGDAEESAFLFAKALQLDPNNAEGWRYLGFLHIQRAQPAEAMAAFERALRLSPLDPMNVASRFGMGDAHLIAGRLKDALDLYRHALSERPGEPALRRRVCALLALTGDIDEARRMARDIQADYPHLTLQQLASANPRAPYLPRYLEGLRLAGLS